MTKFAQNQALRDKIVGILAAIGRERDDDEALIEVMPPYNQYVASLKYRIRLFKISLAAVITLSLILLGIQIFEKSALLERLEQKDVYLVPGLIPNILRIRANTLSDSLVYEFADWFIDNLTNINFEEATVKINTLSGYMTPELKTRFLAEMKPKVELWTGRRVDQRFAFDPIKQFERTTEGRTTRFTVETWGTVRKSMEGRDLPAYREKITLVFQTRPVSSEKTWIFEVASIERKTSQEIQDETIKTE